MNSVINPKHQIKFKNMRTSLYALRTFFVTKLNLEEFLRKLFEKYRLENWGKQY